MIPSFDWTQPLDIHSDMEDAYFQSHVNDVLEALDKIDSLPPTIKKIWRIQSWFSYDTDV